MDEERTRIEKRIREAFRGVVLGKGIGLREGCGLDDYADSKTLAEYRTQDERKSWESIPSDELNDYSTSLSYFDAEGMRFHLPAFLIDELSGASFTYSIVFHLTHLSADDRRIGVLSHDQKQAVREFLTYKLNTLEEPNLSFERPLIEHALTKVWHNRS